MEAVVLFIAVVLVASILQTATGFGFAIIAMPLMILLYEPREAIQMVCILSLVISLAVFMNTKKDIDFAMIRRFLIGCVLGLPLGLLVLMSTEVHTLRLTISVIILVLTGLLMLQFRMRQTRVRDLVVGVFSGAMTTSMGMSGPPLLLYFAGTDTAKEKLRATTLAFFLVTSAVSLVLLVIFTGTNQEIWISSLYGLPVVLVGLYLGQRLFVWISPKLFKVIVYLILLFTGLYLLGMTLWELA